MFFGKREKPEVVVPETITGAWLFDRLKENLSYQDTPLEQIVVTRELKHQHSRVVFFQAIYASEFVHGYPVRWMAKVRTGHEGEAEGRFYDLAQKVGGARYLLEFGGVVDLGEGVSVMLLKNMQPDYRLMVSADQVYSQGEWRPAAGLLNAAIAELARFHADWWQSDTLKLHPDIFLKGGWWGRKADFIDQVAERQQQVSAFKLSQSPSAAIDNLLDSSIQALPHIAGRLNQEPLTCVHGDCYPWHFFVSRADQSLKLFDLEFVGYNTPAHDLVSLLAYWRGSVQEVLEYYYQCLVENGVHDYEFTQLEIDIKLAIYGYALTTIHDWQRGCSEELWKNKLNGLLGMLSATDLMLPANRIPMK